MSDFVTIEDCCDILDHLRVPITATKRKAGEYPYYGANGIQDYVEDYIFDGDFILLAEDGGHFGSKEKPIAYRVSGKCWVNNHAHILKAKEGYDPDFICYAIMFYDINSLVNGTTRKKLTQAAMRQMLVPNQPYTKQATIAHELSSLSKLIDKRKKQLLKLDELIKSRFIEMFGDPVENPKGWDMDTIDNIADVGSSRRIFESEYVGTGVPFYRTKEIVELSQGLQIGKPLYISNSRYIELSKNNEMPSVGDLLISAVGTIGTIWEVNTSMPFYFKDGNIIWLRKIRRMNGRYFRLALMKLIAYHIGGLASGSAYNALTIVKLKQMLIPVPPKQLQDEFANFVQEVEKAKAKIQLSLEKLETCYKALMQEYFG